RYFSPSLRGMSLQFGGKMDETRTRFCEAMPASRSAISKEVRRSLCLPTPLVKKRRFGTMSLPNGETLRRVERCGGPRSCAGISDARAERLSLVKLITNSAAECYNFARLER